MRTATLFSIGLFLFFLLQFFPMLHNVIFYNKMKLKSEKLKHVAKHSEF